MQTSRPSRRAGFVARLRPAAGADEEVARGPRPATRSLGAVHHHHRPAAIQDRRCRERNSPPGSILAWMRSSRPSLIIRRLMWRALGQGRDGADRRSAARRRNRSSTSSASPMWRRTLAWRRSRTWDAHRRRRWLGADEAVVGQQIGAVGGCSPAPIDFEMERACVAERGAGIESLLPAPRPRAAAPPAVPPDRAAAGPWRP